MCVIYPCSALSYFEKCYITTEVWTHKTKGLKLMGYVPSPKGPEKGFEKLKNSLHKVGSRLAFVMNVDVNQPNLALVCQDG